MTWKTSLKNIAKKGAVSAAKGAGKATKKTYEVAKEIDYAKHAKQIAGASKTTYRGMHKAIDSQAGQATTNAIKSVSTKTTNKVVNSSKEAGAKAVRSVQKTDAQNFYGRAADALHGTADAILREGSGTSARISRVAAMKIGGAGTAAGLFGLASLLGTASTGTAISTLSGAAFTNSALAWLGGSVATGSVVLGVGALTGGFAAAIGTVWFGRKYVLGKKRARSELIAREEAALDACMAMGAGFRDNQEKRLTRAEAKALSQNAFIPLVQELEWIESRAKEWPAVARKRLASARRRIERLLDYLKTYDKLHHSAGIGVVSAVMLKLSSEPLPSFSGDEILVLDAIRRSSTELENASVKELALYVQGLSPVQIEGFQSNVKGIYHEFHFAGRENADGDEYTAEIFQATNHPGSDVRLINTETGEVTEIQLKATEYAQYVREHNQRYQDTEVFVTDELAQKMGVSSSGFSNAKLQEDVDGVTHDLQGSHDEDEVMDSMLTAGMVSLALNVKLLLGGQMSAADKKQLMSGAAASSATAGLFTLLIG